MIPHRLLDGAIADIQVGLAYYIDAEDGDPTIALRFDDAVRSAIEDVCEAPRRWRPIPEEPSMRKRPLDRPFSDWSVLYREEDGAVVVYAVFYGRQRPGSWRLR